MSLSSPANESALYDVPLPKTGRGILQVRVGVPVIRVPGIVVQNVSLGAPQAGSCDNARGGVAPPSIQQRRTVMGRLMGRLAVG